VLAWRDGQLKLQRQETLDCNWLQAMENSADITHTYFLHGHRLHLQGVRDRAVNYFYRPYEKYGFQPFEWGILKSWVRSSGLSPLGPERGGGTPLIFPNMLRVLEHPLHCMHWRVPIDDTHTEIFVAEFLRNKDGREEDRSEDPPIEQMAPQRRPDGEYALDSFFSQDKMAWETGGPINDRSQEHLGATDRGIILYRQMLREQIEIVGRGGEPMALVRDPEKNKIIEVPEWVTEMDPGIVKSLGGASALSMERVFDERHEVFEVPFGAARPRDGKTR
jgi:5,5'-dehydrodivanillate O-demethylase